MNVLAIGAHPDDIDGCKGALTAYRERGDRLYLLVMTAGWRGSQDVFSRIKAQEEAAALLGAHLVWGGFEHGAVPDGQAAVELVQATVIRFGIGLVYTHAPRDSNRDHRATAEATLAACRGACTVRLYETATSLGFQHRLCRQRPLLPTRRSMR